MTDTDALLLALQMGDSAFPSGGFAFSWGLETLVERGVITGRDDVAVFARAQCRSRWATADRVFLNRALEAQNVYELSLIDREVEAMTLPAELRAGSKRAGRALLRAHATFGHRTVSEYRRAVAGETALGHLAVAQAVSWKAAGLGRADIEAMSVFGLLSGIAQAAIRLAILGPLDAQSLTAELRSDLLKILDDSPPTSPHAFTPAAEIAVMQHETAQGRLFAN